MSTNQPKRGRPRLYDYVDVTIRAKLPVGVFHDSDYVTAAEVAAGLLAEDEAKVQVKVNGKRIRF